MSGDNAKRRVRVLAEDRRSERLIRKLLDGWGYDRRRVEYITAPAGSGAAEAWVRVRYVEEVRRLRARSNQTGLCLIAMRDGDAAGLDDRKRDLDEALRDAGLAVRGQDPIATPVPTWSVETWLLHLLGTAVNEVESKKAAFEQAYRTSDKEEQALRGAAQAWPGAEPRPGSLDDGRAEFQRIGGS